VPHRLCLVLAVVTLSVYGMAQSPDRIEVFGGYTYIDPDFSLVAANGVSGWNASVDFRGYDYTGFVADVSGLYPRQHYGPVTASGQSYTFLFGPQFTFSLGRFSPFAHVLAGLAHVTPGSFSFVESNNSFGVAAGGGVDYSVKRHIAIRGQADWLYTHFTPIAAMEQGTNFTKNRNVARISTGVVFKF
jgi:opacity protein-like surface antigen